RTYPGTHPKRGSFFTRGSTRDRYARYTEEGGPYVDNMERLLRKFDTAKTLVPAPIITSAKSRTPYGVIYFGSTSPAMSEAAELLAEDGIVLDLMRIRAFPFGREVTDFIAAHERVFLVEQNRDAQLRTLLLAECGIDPAVLTSILHYDGTPITARFIQEAITGTLKAVPEGVRVKSE
ncbi:MAG: 2-oxoacid:acceptor oxidoreductase subunit alpha, partial [Hyphomicrobiales bacterium]|nr:2-oxoacid:acceptor oxidoreductase subunit alpha [Hyphomicrobiales bacterium]